MTLQIPVMRTLIVLTLLLAGLVGCSYMPSMPKYSDLSLTTYKIDIQQGNFIDQEMLAKLQPGMTHAQVKFIMGTPLVTDIFHANRWDYIYIDRKKGKLITKRRAVLYFAGDKLERIEDFPSEGKAADTKAGVAPGAVPLNGVTVIDKPVVAAP